MNDDKILDKLSEHDGQFIKLNTKLTEHDKKFTEHDKRFDRLITVLIQQGESIKEIQETMVTKDEFNKVMDNLDRLVTLYEKKDQELTIATHDMIKLEKRVDVHDRQIGKLVVAAGVRV